jgi:hypothetical protein
VIFFNVLSAIECEIHYTNITTGVLNDITELREVVTKMERRWKINLTGSGDWLEGGAVLGLARKW